MRELKRYLWLVWTLVALSMIGLGLGRGEWRVVKRHADALCTACIGLTVDYQPSSASDRPGAPGRSVAGDGGRVPPIAPGPSA